MSFYPRPTRAEMDQNDYLGGHECDCFPTDGTHEPDCSLWSSTDFADGWAGWDDATRRLVWIVEPREVDDEGVLAGDADDWLGWGDEDEGHVTIIPTKSVSGIPLGGWTYTPKCRHYQQEVKLPDGTVVYASSAHHDRKDDPIPDLGIYLDGCWTPDCIAFYVGCPDYGVPVPSAANVLHIANEGLRVAREGGRVEIGCVGGHGRTGLMLAIIVVLTQNKRNAKRAIAYVHKNYCKEAIESKTQEWYVAGIVAELAGKPWPKKPEVKKYTYSPAVVAAVPTVAPSTTLIPMTPAMPDPLFPKGNVVGLVEQIKSAGSAAVALNTAKQQQLQRLEALYAETYIGFPE